MPSNTSRSAMLFTVFLAAACTHQVDTETGEKTSRWLLVDNFENAQTLQGWTNVDAQNDTDPFVPNAQVSVVRIEPNTSNQYMLRKPAADGVIGNRKAIGFKALPVPVKVGDTATLYARVNVEYFPNNHSYGLSNSAASDIAGHGYDAFEPMIRITDKAESNGYKNDGTLMVLDGYKTYAKIASSLTGADAKPMVPGQWYEVWAVVNNAALEEGGQRYDLYVKGGEFKTQQRVFTNAVFRKQRALPLTSFIAISNTGSKKTPYGNGGVQYDDIYLAPGKNLSSPLR